MKPCSNARTVGGTAFDALVEQVRVNEEKMRRFQKMEMHFLTATSLPRLLYAVLDDCRRTFALDALTLSLVDPHQELRGLLEEVGMDWRAQRNLLFFDTALAIERSYAGHARPRLGPYSRAQHAALFPGLQLSLSSVALLPLLRLGEWIGSLNLGSGDPQRFDATMATDFLEHLAALLAVCLQNATNQERLRRAGLVDKLTAVNNRRFFDQRLQEEVNRAVRQQIPLSCLFVDIDYFKRVNDRYGHQSGDQVLAAVAHRIHSQLRNMDVLARYGGEEFTALLSNADVQEATEVAERVRRDVEAYTIINADGEPLRVTVSIGVATLRPGQGHVDMPSCAARLLEYADQGVYQAKRAGRNRVVCLGPTGCRNARECGDLVPGR